MFSATAAAICGVLPMSTNMIANFQAHTLYNDFYCHLEQFKKCFVGVLLSSQMSAVNDNNGI